MKPQQNILAALGAAFALSLASATTQAQPASAQAPAPQAGAANDSAPRPNLVSRVQNKTYLFTDTGEQIPYAVFVSSKVSQDKKAPLVLALRGYNSRTSTFMSGAALAQAEAGGYILVGVMGYNSTGGYGMNMGSMGGRGRGPVAATATNATNATNATSTNLPAARASQGRGSSIMQGGTAETDTAKVSELSEKDVMNVLALMRKDYNVDNSRVYLVGHSQGGGGAVHIAEKYPTNWAGVAMLAPGVFGFQATEQSNIKNIPLYLTVGAKDTMIASVQRFHEQLTAAHIAHEYSEVPGFDHGGVIMASMSDVFKFFGQHSKPEAK